MLTLTHTHTYPARKNTNNDTGPRIDARLWQQQSSPGSQLDCPHPYRSLRTSSGCPHPTLGCCTGHVRGCLDTSTCPSACHSGVWRPGFRALWVAMARARSSQTIAGFASRVSVARARLRGGRKEREQIRGGIMRESRGWEGVEAELAQGQMVIVCGMGQLSVHGLGNTQLPHTGKWKRTPHPPTHPPSCLGLRFKGIFYPPSSCTSLPPLPLFKPCLPCIHPTLLPCLRTPPSHSLSHAHTHRPPSPYPSPLNFPGRHQPVQQRDSQRHRPACRQPPHHPNPPPHLALQPVITARPCCRRRGCWR